MRPFYSLPAPWMTCLLIPLILSSCKPSAEPQSKDELTAEVVADSNNEYAIMADTITYDVIVRNANPDDEWTTLCLQRLDREKLIGSIFDAVYSGKLKAYDILSNTELPLNRVRKMEKEKDFDRSKIGKIQFTELWLFNEQDLSMEKTVRALAMGYELYDTEGKVRGYKPVFKVYLNATGIK
jgi:hypothetical protein